jgi:hypothetical protein
VYLVVAACGAVNSSGGFFGDDSDDAGESGSADRAHLGDGIVADGIVTDDERGVIDALLDPVLDPVGEAQAAPPDIATESCSRVGGSYVYAEHAYPGKTVEDLAHLRVVMRYKTDAGVTQLPGYSRFVTLPWLKPGYAAVICGTTAAMYVDDVTFILP